MTRSESTWSRNGSTLAMAVGGLMAKPTCLPRERIFQISGDDLAVEFDMNGHAVGAGLGKGFEEDVGAGAHQMDVKGQAAQRAKGLDDGGAEGNVGHKMAVHDVEVKPVGAGAVDAGGFGAEAGEIRGQERRGDDHLRGGSLSHSGARSSAPAEKSRARRARMQ